MERKGYYEPKPDFTIPQRDEPRDLKLERIKIDKDSELALRSINILKGTRHAKEGEPDFEQIKKEVAGSDKMINEFMECVKEFIEGERKKLHIRSLDPIIRFDNKLIRAFLPYKRQDAKQLLNDIRSRVQAKFNTKYPEYSTEYNKTFGGTRAEGIYSMVRCIQEMNAEKITPDKIREFFVNTQIDDAYAIDLVECIYNPTSQEMNIDEMNLIQVKTKAVESDETEQIQSKHFQFTNAVIGRLQEFDARYNPEKILAKDAPEAELKELTNSIHETFLMQLVEYYGNEDKISKQEFAATALEQLGNGVMAKYKSTLQRLPHADKINYLLNIIDTVQMYTSDTTIIEDLSEIKNILHTDLQTNSTKKAKQAAKIKTINSVIWSSAKGKQEVKMLFDNHKPQYTHSAEQPILTY